jgi:4-carboxymuconolactone decarboxylase
MSEYDDGMRMRRRVLGDEHVDRATANASAMDADFQRWITETAWGGVWARPGLDLRTRSLITIAILGGLNHEELELHLRAARNTGVSPAEIGEALLHVAVYAGVPAANRAFRVAKMIYDEEETR